MDKLFNDISIITMDRQIPILKHAYLGVTGDKIVYVDMVPPSEPAKKVIYGADKVLMPGLVNAHTHIAMTALRGYADDMELGSWLFGSIIPAESRMTADMVYHSAVLGIMEAVASGTTSICDMYFHAPSVARAASELGIRAHIGNVPLELGEDFNPNDRSIIETLELLNEYGDNKLISVFTGVHSAHNSNPKVWDWVTNTADKYNMPFSMHMSETRDDVESCIRRFGITPTALYEKAGLFSHPSVAAHCVWVSENDMDIMAANGVTAASCPVSNLKLASGIAPLVGMKEKGINIALATDGAASNNNLDMFEEIKLAALLQKYVTADASALTAYDALYFATVGGSKALGRGDRSGRLKVGFDADIIMLDFNAPHLTPSHDIISNVVYSAKGSDVELTMVNGRILYENRRFINADVNQAIDNIKKLIIPNLYN